MGLTYEQAAERIMIALDYPDAAAAEALLKQVEGIPCYMKVGMQLFYSAGPSFVAELKQRGYRVFLDLKLHDIPNTVKGASASIARMGVDLFNVHAAGGVRMMEAALEGVDSIVGAGPNRPMVIAVTQLTSTSQATLNNEIGISGTPAQAVVRYAELAKQAGMAGVVASPQEVELVKEACGREFRTVTPGIRPSWAATDDQTRIMTPREALQQGTDYMVIGRPITAAPNPREALNTILKELM